MGKHDVPLCLSQEGTRKDAGKTTQRRANKRKTKAYVTTRWVVWKKAGAKV